MAKAPSTPRTGQPARLVAAAKNQSSERVAEAIRLGVLDIGENRVQEAEAKRPEVEAQGGKARWHLIGPLQSNKAREAVAVFDVIHTIDRLKIAEALSKACMESGRTLECFIQVNIGREDQKSGVPIEETAALVAAVRALPGLTLVGLMAVPPADEPPAPYFALLAEMARKLELPELSMGMSGDFETAIRLGATYVRIGTALFGPRLESGAGNLESGK